MKPKEYEIRKLEDFCLVPEDRIGDCIVDFAAWVAFVRNVPHIPGFDNKHFIWIDDGITGVKSVRLNIFDKTGVKVDEIRKDLRSNE